METARFELGHTSIDSLGHLSDLLAQFLQDPIGVGICLTPRICRLAQGAIFDIGRALLGGADEPMFGHALGSVDLRVTHDAVRLCARVGKELIALLRQAPRGLYLIGEDHTDLIENVEHLCFVDERARCRGWVPAGTKHFLELFEQVQDVLHGFHDNVFLKGDPPGNEGLPADG